MITFDNARLMRGEHVLLDDTSVTIQAGCKVGVIGRNGSGKTSLFACLNGDLALDKGNLSMPGDLRCAWMQQETEGSPRSALEHVIDGDSDYRALEARIKAAEEAGDDHALARLHGEMDRMGGWDIQARAEKLLSGLGFAPEQFHWPVSRFSGGWRIRLNLAAALMAPSDLLLLDEPTNHLDLEATLWLEQWLNRYQGTLLLISHDRSFLDRVIDHVLSFENRQLVLYKGNYSAYEHQRSERIARQQALYEKQQRRRAEIEQFVHRFRAKAHKAAQAQSRLKELDRMREVAPAHVESPFEFRFPQPDRLPQDLLTLKEAVIGYEQPLVRGIDLRIQAGSRIGLLGHNGSGKSTLLKTLAGEMPFLAGEISPSRHLNIGYFAQHQVDFLDPGDSPLSLLQRSDPEASEQKLRDYLGGFDFRGERIHDPIRILSGGEKSRLALARIIWHKPNLLLMDEPTNHLDLEMRQALNVALQAYEGAMVVVSHDRYLLNNTVDEFFTLHDGQFREFNGTLEEYADWLQQQQQAGGRAAGDDEPAAGGRKKARRQQAAARRQELAPLRKEVKSLEKDMERINRRLAEIETAMSDPALYETEHADELNDLLQEQGRLRGELQRIEEAWLEKSEYLEQSL